MATVERYPMGPPKLLYLAQFARYKHFVFAVFAKNSKWPPFWERQIFFCKLGWPLCRDRMGVKNFVEIALSSPVFKI